MIPASSNQLSKGEDHRNGGFFLSLSIDQQNKRILIEFLRKVKLTPVTIENHHLEINLVSEADDNAVNSEIIPRIG